VTSKLSVWRYGAKLEDAYNAVHAYDLEKLKEADEKAGGAASSAKTAHEEADAVSKETDSIHKRPDTASGQLHMIEEQVRTQGPRWKLLEAHKDDFITALKPLAGQKFMVMYCGSFSSVTPEQFRLAQDLMSFLEPPNGVGAGRRWLMNSGNNEWHTCSHGASSAGGNLIVVSSTAGTSIKEAEVALWNEVNSN